MIKMPRRKSVPVATETPLQLEGDWWTRFLIEMGYMREPGSTFRPSASSATSEEVQEALKDRLFEKYLQFGPGKAGGPATIADFLQLNPDQQKWYVDVFKTWKQVVKRDGIDKILLKMET